MWRYRWVLCALFALIVVLPSYAAIDTVVVHNFAFEPSTLTINQGDTVVWHNILGLHNVHNTDTPSLFGNAVQNAPWYYMFVFNVPPALYHYQCDQHPQLMQGTVTVQPLEVPETAPLVLAASPVLDQNYPNPFNSRTTIAFSIPTDANVRLTVLNVLGQQVRQLYTGRLQAGEHSFSFDAEGLTSGLYFYRLETPIGVLIRTMRFVK